MAKPVEDRRCPATVTSGGNQLEARTTVIAIHVVIPSCDRGYWIVPFIGRSLLMSDDPNMEVHYKAIVIIPFVPWTVNRYIIHI